MSNVVAYELDEQTEVRFEFEPAGGFAPAGAGEVVGKLKDCLLYTSPSPRDRQKSRMPSSA